MAFKELERDSIIHGWNFFERTIRHYSLILRMLDSMKNGNSLLTEGPKIFVEEMGFDACKVILLGKEKKESFFSLDQSAKDVFSLERIESLFRDGMSFLVLENSLGFMNLYIFPFKEEIEKRGFLVLGSLTERKPEASFLKELEILVEIYNRCLLCEEKNLEDETSQDRYREIIDALPLSIFLVDKKGKIFFVNATAEKEFGSKKASLSGDFIYNIFPCINDEFYRDEKAISDEVSYLEGNTYRTFKLESVPFAESKLFLIYDIAMKRISEEQEIHRSKIESIGLLAGGVAHDFNNILTGILGYAGLLKSSLKGEEKLFRFADIIESSAKRGAKLTQHLLNFSRRQKRVFGVVNINVIIEDVLFLLKESLREIEVVKELDEYIPPIKGDECGLQQVFLNLCINARDAMEGRGVLRVKTGIKKYMRSNEYIYITIEDTGKGMDEEIRKGIFEPFFTTKERKASLGMGLYLVKNIIKEHNGLIEVESEKGKGTKFHIYLPMDIAEIKEETQESENKTLAEKKRILVVDDELVIRELVRDLLEKEGYEVYEAKDGIEALEFFRDHKDEIDLVILDMIMPGLKGDEVLVRMKEIREDIKVILSSGFMNEQQRERLKKLKVDGFLDKPYRDAEIKKVVSSLLSD